MNQYEDLLHDVLHHGVKKSDRTGTGTRSLFGRQLRFNLADGFPLITTKRVHLKSVVAELVWMLSGSTNNNDLERQGVSIWREWARPDGDLGPIYGKQWRKWPRYKKYADAPGFYLDPIDQISDVLRELRANPDSRRLVVSAWNPADIPSMALAPCHCLFQFNTRPIDTNERVKLLAEKISGKVGPGDRGSFWFEKMLVEHAIPSRYLDLQLYQRSADVFLGVPFNIASYALLTSMVAQVVGMVPGEFIWTGGDVHLYANHCDQATEQLSRAHRLYPKLVLNPDVRDLFAFRWEDVTVDGYDPHPAIAAPVAV